MRNLSLSMVMLAAAVACAPNTPNSSTTLLPAKLPSVQHQPIIGGTVDPGDPAVIELFYFESYASSECTGSMCTQNCFNPATGQACSGTGTCMCGSGATCSSELIGPHTLVTAGHCTDTTAGGELSGPQGPPMVLCTTLADINNVLSYTPDANCNLVVFAIFNNTCTTNDQQNTCELNLIFGSDGGGPAAGGGNFNFVDQLVNPGYSPNTEPPGDDNDIGLAHLPSSTLQNGGCEPPLLTFNRASLGAQCTDLGPIKFVGYGITSANGTTSGVKYTVTHDTGVLDTYHDYEGNPSLIFSSACPITNPAGDPTCSGDSGGPSLNSSGEIIAVTSLGDQSCASYGQDSRIDAHASWIDSTMTAAAWGDVANGQDGGPDGCNQGCNTCVSDSQMGSGACAADLTACGNDTACVNVLNCSNNCGSTQTCVTNCESDAGSTAADQFNTLSTCIDTTCATACGLPTTTTASSSSSSGSVTTGPTAVASTSSGATTGPTAAASTSSGTTASPTTTTTAGSTGATSVAGGSTSGSTSITAGSTSGASGSGHGSTGGTIGANGTTGAAGTLGGTTTGSSSTGTKSGGCGSAGSAASLSGLLPLLLLGLSRRRRR